MARIKIENQQVLEDLDPKETKIILAGTSSRYEPVGDIASDDADDPMIIPGRRSTN